MIYRKINIKAKGSSIKVSVPESWHDVTFKQFNELQKESDVLGRLSILTGVPSVLFNDYPELADFYVWLETNLAWSSEWDNESSEVEVFVLKDETFAFPKDVGMLSIGLYKDIQNEAKENEENILDIYPLICASYYQILKDGEYDYKAASEYVDMFNSQPCVKVYNAASFFLSKVQGLRSGTKVGLKARVIRWIKNLLVSIGFQRYSGLKLFRRN